MIFFTTSHLPPSGVVVDHKLYDSFAGGDVIANNYMFVLHVHLNTFMLICADG